METGFLNFHDGEHFSSILPSPLYDRDILDDSESSLLDIMRDDFSYEASQFADSHDLWDHEQELNGDMAVLPLTVPLDGPMPKLEPHSKEDFQKMLSEWQEHLGSMQASDTDDMDVKDIVGMDIVMPKHVPEELPDDIFDDSTSTVHLVDKFVSCTKQQQDLDVKHKVTLSLSLKEDFSAFSLDNFLECDDEDDDDRFGLTVAEEDPLTNDPLAFEPEITEPLVSHLPKEMLDSPAEASNTLRTESDEGCADIDNIKIEIEEDCIDVETVSEQIPVLEAGDLKSLLEQFEASEAFNTTSTTTPGKPSILDTHLYAMATQQLEISAPNNPAAVAKTMNPALSHQNIRDSLPKEVIERIKASGRKKVIPLIPAMPSKRPGRSGTRMQDAAATLSRNKLLKLVSGSGSGGGESVQLDHDYCTFNSNSSSNSEAAAPPKSFYHSDASEYMTDKLQNRQQRSTVVAAASAENSTEENSGAKSSSYSTSQQDKVYSRLPEYYVVLAPQKVLERNNRHGSSKDDGWDKNSRKDSGLESGDVSDASEETIGSNVCDSAAVVTNRKRSSNDANGGDSSTKVSVSSKGSSVAPHSSVSVKECNSNVVSVNGKDIKLGATKSGGSRKTSVAESVVNNNNNNNNNALSQQSIKTKETAMVSVLKKCQVVNNSGASGQSLLVRSISVNSDSSSNQEAMVVKERPQGPKKRKLNLEEYRSRLKELDRIRSSRDSSRASSPTIQASEDIDVSKADEGNSNNTSSAPIDTGVEEMTTMVPKQVEGESEDPGKQARPKMHSVEVQTQTPGAEEVKEADENERRAGQARDRRHRQYRSRRASSSSSSGSSSSSSSSSSSNSHNSRRRRTNSQSARRQRPSQRRSSGGHSVSSSGSRSQSICSRSRSNSSRSSSSSGSSRSRSRSSGPKTRRSPNRWHPRSVTRRSQQPHEYRRRSSTHSGYRGWKRSRSPIRGANRKPATNDWLLTEREKQRQVEERRVIYVGRIDEGTSKAELHRRFELFGPIVDISVHFREHGDNYGFVTFAYKVDAYEAVEHGNDDPNLPHYDLCFGGRRAFCKTRYADLDGMATIGDSLSGSNGYSSRPPAFAGRTRPSQAEDSFDLLLREAQAKLRKRKV